MAKKRLITNPFLEELGVFNPDSKVMAVNADGELVNTGYTIQQLLNGVATIDADDVDDDTSTHKFTDADGVQKLDNLIITGPADIDVIQTAIMELSTTDLATCFTDQLDF